MENAAHTGVSFSGLSPPLSLVWTKNEGITSALSVSKNTLVASSQWHGLYGNDLESGKLKWHLGGRVAISIGKSNTSDWPEDSLYISVILDLQSGTCFYDGFKIHLSFSVGLQIR